ncbi:MAG: putative toxin-antitoxin system toxin component, PIN family [Opitutae bacterium]|nr:putative toxin-antitoxin system toxin component, PIN family [Opitutae bacterium]
MLDTNVLISAALQPNGSPRAVVETLRAVRGVLLFSDETFDELQTRLHRAKFDKYVSHNSRSIFLAQLETVSEWVSIIGAKLGCRDPDDDKLLETALMGEADCIVTGDQDLQVMSPFLHIPILSPTEFLAHT